MEKCQISVTKVRELSNRMIFAVYQRKIILDFAHVAMITASDKSVSKISINPIIRPLL